MLNRIGANTLIWESPFSDASLQLAKRVRALGFDVLEICVEDPGLLTARAVKASTEAEGLSVSVCGAFGPDRDLSNESPAKRAQALDYIKTCINFAVEVGSPHVAGPMYSTTGKTRLLDNNERAQQWQWAVEGLRQAIAYARDAGVRLAIEPLNRFETDLVNTVEQGLRLCSDIGYENVGLVLDTFHMNIEEKSIPQAIALASDRVFHFHASENDRGTPGSGHVPWHEVFRALQSSAYDGQVIIESFTPEIKELAGAVSLWRSLGAFGDELAREGLAFLRGALTAVSD